MTQAATVPAEAARTPHGVHLLEVKDLQTYFPVRSGLLQRVTSHVKAVDGVSFTLRKGETLGLVGESGCGKTTVGRSILRLIEPTGGTVAFEGKNVLAATGASMKALRREMQIIFQDPAGSLNPRMRIAQIVGEPLVVHNMVKNKDDLRDKAEKLLVRCGMPAAAADRFPHEFSGGQRQRIAIARAMVLKPKFVMLDEPTSALDMSVQAQVVDLLRDLQRRRDLAYLFISHDLKVVKALANEIIVMRNGKVVERGTAERVFTQPETDYTRALLAAAFAIQTAPEGIVAQ